MAPGTKRDKTPISATPPTRKFCSHPMFFLSIISITALVTYSYVSDRFVVTPDSAVGVVRTTTFHTTNNSVLQPLMIVTRHDNATTPTHYIDTPNETIVLRHSVNSTTTSETVAAGSSKTKSNGKSSRMATKSISSNTKQKQHGRSDPSRSTASSRTVGYFDTPNETVALQHSVNSSTTSETVLSGSSKTKSNDKSSRTATTSTSSNTKEKQLDHSDPSWSSASSRTVGTTGSSSRSTTLFITNTSNISSSSLSSSSFSRMIAIQRERPSYKKTCYFEYDALPIGLGITYEVSVLYHVGMLKNWRSIMLDQFHTMEICGLGYMTSDLTISFSNPSTSTTENETVEMLKEVLHQFPFMKQNGLNKNVTFINAAQAFPYEKPLLEHIGNVCRRHHSASNKMNEKKKIVFYFHSKGTSKYVEKNIIKMKEEKYRKRYKHYENVFYWRKYMEWFLLEKPTLCIRALLSDRQAKACGVNLKVEPMTHYSGNFWTSTCHHIKDLPIGRQWPLDGPHKRFLYISSELWIGNYTISSYRQEYRFVNLFLMHANFYWYSATPAKYEWIVSKQEFLRINCSSILKRDFDYYFPNQTDLWLDYLSGIKGLTKYPS